MVIGCKKLDIKKLIKLILTIVFLIAQLTFYIIILIGKFEPIGHIYYTVILFNFLYSLLWITNKDKWLIHLGLFFTCFADFCLAFQLHGFYNQELGVTFFLVVQLCYFAYILLHNDKKFWKAHIITRLALTIIGLVLPIILIPVINPGSKADYLSIITCVYLANFVCNIVYAFFNFKKDKLLPIALILFLLCDLTTGLIAAQDVYITIPASSLIYKIVFTDFDFTWMWYLPSQVLLVVITIPKIREIAKITQK